jgi:DNA-binding phage protein
MVKKASDEPKTMLGKLLSQTGKTISSIERETNISRETVYQLINGKAAPSFKTLEKLEAVIPDMDAHVLPLWLDFKGRHKE